MKRFIYQSEYKTQGYVYNLGSLIRLHRIKNNYSLRQLSIKTNITHTAINQLELAKVTLDDYQIAKLCGALKIDYNLLYENNNAITDLYNQVLEAHFYSRDDEVENILEKILQFDDIAKHSILYVKYLLSIFICENAIGILNEEGQNHLTILNQVTWEHESEEYQYFLIYTCLYYLNRRRRDKVLVYLKKLENLNLINNKILSLFHAYSAIVYRDKNRLLLAYHHTLDSLENLRLTNNLSRVVASLISLGDLAGDLNENDLAIQYFNEAVSFFPLLDNSNRKSFYHRTIGRYYLYRKKWDKAIFHFQKVDITLEHAESKYYFWYVFALIHNKSPVEINLYIKKGKESFNYKREEKLYQFLDLYIKNYSSDETKIIAEECYFYYKKTYDYRSMIFFENILIELCLETNDKERLFKFEWKKFNKLK